MAPYVLPLLAWGRESTPPQWRPLQWRHLRFPNRLGVAGGVDKNGKQIAPWTKLGAGFIEVGTVTPRPQGPNPGKIMDRDMKAESLWNFMGFPNQGAESLRGQLAKLSTPHPSPIFVNLGKNRDTKIENAAADYTSGMRYFAEFADAFVINISSPNTLGLRELQSEKYLSQLLKSIGQQKNDLNKDVPLLLKLSPDLSEAELDQALHLGLENGIDGWILTNTTSHRPAGCPFPAQGGLSGRPLAERSENLLQQTLQKLGAKKGDRLVISVGGVLSPQDVLRRLELGADLVEVYSALVFQGPFFFATTARYFKDIEP